MMPSDTLASVGVPQPSFTIGPMRNTPSLGGKYVRRSLMIFGALAITSLGNMIESSEPVRTPSAMASSRIERLRPSKPPRPSNVKPKPSWMPVPNSTDMMISSEKPGVPSGNLVLTMQIALIVTMSNSASSSAPSYSPRAVSTDRKPPPFTTPASTDNPMAVGALNPIVRSTGRIATVVSRPMWSTTACSGPRCAPPLTDVSSTIASALNEPTR